MPEEHFERIINVQKIKNNNEKWQNKKITKIKIWNLKMVNY